jgi:hypothetical protein
LIQAENEKDLTYLMLKKRKSNKKLQILNSVLFRKQKQNLFAEHRLLKNIGLKSNSKVFHWVDKLKLSNIQKIIVII